MRNIFLATIWATTAMLVTFVWWDSDEIYSMWLLFAWAIGVILLPRSVMLQIKDVVPGFKEPFIWALFFFLGLFGQPYAAIGLLVLIEIFKTKIRGCCPKD